MHLYTSPAHTCKEALPVASNMITRVNLPREIREMLREVSLLRGSLQFQVFREW